MSAHFIRCQAEAMMLRHFRAMRARCRGCRLFFLMRDATLMFASPSPALAASRGISCKEPPPCYENY